MPQHPLIVPFLALLGVLGLIWLIQRMVVLGRRNGRIARLLPHAPPDAARLRVVQSLQIDPKRRLVLLAWDQREILLLTGGPADLVLPPGQI